MYIFNFLVSWRSENEPDFAGGWPLCEQREDRDLGCGMGSWLLWAESGLASHPLEDRDRDMRLARLQSVDTGAAGWWVWWPLCPRGLVWPAQCHRDIRDKCHTLWCATSDEQERKWHIRSDPTFYKCFSRHLFLTKSLLSAVERRRAKSVHDFRMYAGRHIFNDETQL